MKLIPIFFITFLFVETVPAGITYKINETWVCTVKKSCLECLRLPQCSWCEETNTCFSSELLNPDSDNLCDASQTIMYVDKPMSFEDNAKCACFAESLPQDCSSPDQPDTVCSNRGKCECGRCFCDPIPDTDHPSKVIMGKYCEYDNFSCNEPRCHEGPYHYFNTSYNLKTSE